MDAITTYADETQWRKTWQGAWKHGVILVFPPEPHLSKITALRNRYAWAQSSDCPAHISLTRQISRPVLPSDVEEIQKKIRRMRRFIVDYGPLVENPPHSRVALAVEQQAELKKLLEAVESASLFETSPKRKYPYLAEMIIAERVSWVQTRQIIEEVKNLPLSGNFNLSSVSYVVPDQNFKFTERLRFFLE